jgi:hypothetical protein
LFKWREGRGYVEHESESERAEDGREERCELRSFKNASPKGITTSRAELGSAELETEVYLGTFFAPSISTCFGIKFDVYSICINYIPEWRT